MLTVALIGLDGAGKTSVARWLATELPMPSRYVYMGLNRDASTHLLPTTRIVRRLRRATGTAPANGVGRAANGAGQVIADPRRRRFRRRLLGPLRLVNRLAEESYLHAVAWFHRRRGRVVILDRHFMSDFFGTDVVGPERSFAQRLHGFVLTHLYPKPDLMIFLDAPPEIAFARKGEGTIEELARRRDDYASLVRVVSAFVRIDASRPLEEVRGDARRAILDALTLAASKPR